MKKNVKKYRPKKRFLILLGVLLYVAGCFGQQFYRIQAVDREIEGYRQTQNTLIQEEKSLKEQIGLLQNKSYIERIAREDLGLIKPGETLLVPGEPGKMPEAKSVQEVSDNIH